MFLIVHLNLKDIALVVIIAISNYPIPDEVKKWCFSNGWHWTVRTDLSWHQAVLIILSGVRVSTISTWPEP